METYTAPVYAVIVAGGQGTRMGTAMPKQFLELEGKPVLYHTIKAFTDAVPGIQIILVLPPHQLSFAQMVLQHFPDRIDLELVPGGETRFHSVQNGLQHIPEDALIMVHDGVRPFVSSSLIHTCLQTAQAQGSAIPALPVTDSMRVLSARGSQPINRDMLRSIQTPQTFRGNVLLPAYQQEYIPSFTDEATVVEHYGNEVSLVPGERNNIKITTPEDLTIAAMLLSDKLQVK
jgi:2-C-methyl-D-erythritol 4-phosphate cytidylyltransferase